MHVVCYLIDQYVTCKLPADDSKLKDLLLLFKIASIRVIAGEAKLVISVTPSLAATYQY